MLKIIISLFAVVSLANAQIDPTFCNFTPLDDRPVPNPNSTQRYQASVEKNSANKGLTEEIREFYDGENNVGISITVAASLQTFIYGYYSTNELILVEGNGCLVKKLNESLDLSPFYVYTDNNGKERITTILGFFLMNNLVAFASLGSLNTVRGIPVREWGACIYETKSKSTLKVTLSYSNEEKWTPAYPLPDSKSVPVQVKIESKTSDGKLNTEISTITQFRPTLFLEEEAYTTPPGVYCPGRSPGKPLPKVPSAFSYIVHKAESVPGTQDLFGNLKVLRIEHDYDKKLHRYDYGEKGVIMTEIHDDDTGLRYKLNNNLNTCEITALSDINDFEISPADFFKFNQDPPFQYVGQRRVRGINCDVWIAPRDRNGNKTTFEWYFMADGWVVQESSEVSSNLPVLLRVDYTKKDNQLGYDLPAQTFYELSNFDKSRTDLFDFDVSSCNQNANKHYRFNIKTDKYELLKVNQGLLRVALTEALLDKTKVDLIRISRVETIFDDGTIYVIFTLIEKPSFIGNKNRTKTDVSLSDAENYLSDSIKKSQFIVNIKLTPAFTITADKDSFITLELRNGRFVYQYIDNGKTTGYTSGSVAGFIIGFLVVGILIGLVGGVFLILKRSAPISIPKIGLFNANYNKETSESA